MATQQRLIEVAGVEPGGAVAGPARVARLKEPDRKQMVIDLVDLERLIPDDHLARAIWALVQQLPTEGFLQENKSVEGHAGRPRICPKMLLSLWVYGYSQGLGEARAIAEEMRYEPALRWMAGNSMVSARTLSEFRIAHPEALRETFENLLGMLEKVGLIDLSQMTLDGTKISSWAGSGSLRREKSLQEHIARAATVVEGLADPAVAAQVTARQQAARARARQERQARLAAAQEELVAIQARKSEAEKAKARVSITEPEVRVMKDGHGGFAPSYNVQVVTESKNKFVVDILATQAPNDQGQLEPALARLAAQGRAAQTLIVDGGYTQVSNLKAALEKQVNLVGPVHDQTADRAVHTAANLAKAGISAAYGPAAFVIIHEGEALRCPAGRELRRQETTQNHIRYVARKEDCGACAHRMECCPQGGPRSVKFRQTDPVAVAFAARMEEDQSRAIYGLRSQVAEFPHLWIKEKLGLRKFHLRGLSKANLEALWAALTYNIQQWYRLDWKVKCVAA